MHMVQDNTAFHCLSNTPSKQRPVACVKPVETSNRNEIYNSHWLYRQDQYAQLRFKKLSHKNRFCNVLLYINVFDWSIFSRARFIFKYTYTTSSNPFPLLFTFDSGCFSKALGVSIVGLAYWVYIHNIL